MEYSIINNSWVSNNEKVILTEKYITYLISILELLADDFIQVHSEKGKKLCICTYTL